MYRIMEHVIRRGVEDHPQIIVNGCDDLRPIAQTTIINFSTVAEIGKYKSAVVC